MTIGQLTALLRRHSHLATVELRIVGLSAIGGEVDEIVTQPAGLTLSKDNRNNLIVQITNAEEA